ncbi:MAG: WD40/YVTN/BNR-like repeat-containing protein, partial [Candidatus Saccharicenans sp.]
MKKSFYVFMALVLVVTGLMLPGFSQKSRKPERIQNTPPEVRLKGFERHRQMKASSPFRQLTWQFLGPINVSGRCTDMAVVTPKGKNYTIYVATASGGVWKTVNEGTTWEPIFDRELSTSIGDIAITPSNSNIIWVGTGEANIFRSSHAGCGVYKSTDGGKTWQHMG